MEEVRSRSRKAARRGTAVGAPLYSVLDALNTFDFFGRNVTYGQPLDLAEGLRATFLDAGHILGSASIFLELKEGAHRCTVLFSGDLDNAGRPLLRDPVVPPQADVVVMETTYGNRLHKPPGSSVEEFTTRLLMVFAAAGMCTGGRVRHHLKHNLWRPNSTIVFVGFAAKGTLARQIIDGARR
jgi:metallo-beta-lactamase family protein